MKELLRNQPGEVTGIRLGVRSRGCNGKSYTMGYASGKQSGEEVVEQDGVKVFVDSRAIMFVVGTVVDFVEDHLKSEFVFMNPNAKGSCGCGESFNV
jgi:iron-sulfur cluster assembly protein